MIKPLTLFGLGGKMASMRVFGEHLRNGSIDFHQIYVTFRQLSGVSFEIKKIEYGENMIKVAPFRIIFF